MDPDEYKFQVSSSSLALQLKFALPLVMTDTILRQKIWISKSEHRSGIKPYHPKCLSFEKYLKQHRLRKTAQVVVAGKLKLPARFESHVDEAALCAYVHRSYKILYLTLKCASDGCADCAEGNTRIVTAEAPGETTVGASNRDRM